VEVVPAWQLDSGFVAEAYSAAEQYRKCILLVDDDRTLKPSQEGINLSRFKPFADESDLLLQLLYLFVVHIIDVSGRLKPMSYNDIVVHS
jgi:hypothetical protein